LFELIGLTFATLFLFLIAAAAGSFYAGIAWFLVRNRECRRLPLILFAAAIPIFSAAYFWLCVAMLPGESLFGDISQPLPNGYSLQALGKMPDFASINKGNSLSNETVALSECIGSLTVSGPFVAGRYSHPFGSFDPKPNEGYFVFDTRTGQFVDFRSLHELESKFGHSAHLVPTQFFRSREPAYKRQQMINKIVMFAPPTLATLGYILCLLCFPLVKDLNNHTGWRGSAHPHPSTPPNIYT
jgi:hypothetical protein